MEFCIQHLLSYTTMNNIHIFNDIILSGILKVCFNVFKAIHKLNYFHCRATLSALYQTTYTDDFELSSQPNGRWSKDLTKQGFTGFFLFR